MNRSRKKHTALFLTLLVIVQVFSSLNVVFAEKATGFYIRGVSGGAYYDPAEKVITASAGKSFDITLESRPPGSDLSHIKAVIENKSPSTFDVSVASSLFEGHQHYWFTSVSLDGQGSAEIVFKDKQDGIVLESIRVQTHSETNTQELETVPVTGINVFPQSLEITVGQTDTISVEIIPSNATENRYSWALDKDGIIDIHTNGTVTGKAPGMVNVTAVSLEGPFQDVCMVTVHAAANTETQNTESVTPLDSDFEKAPELPEKQDPSFSMVPKDTAEEIKEITNNTIEKDRDENIPENQNSPSNIVPEDTMDKIKEITNNILDNHGDGKNPEEQDATKIIIPEDTVKKIREITNDMKEKAGDIKVDGVLHQLYEYESQLIEKRLEKKLKPEDVARKQVGMKLFEDISQQDETQILKMNEKAKITIERLKKIAEKENLSLDETRDVNGIVLLKEKDTSAASVKTSLYELKTKQADKLIDKIFSKTIDELVKLLKKKNLSSSFLETSLGLFSRYVKDTKDDLLLTDDEKIHTVKEEIGLKDDISAELYLRNNQWTDRETAAGVWQDILTKKKAAQAFNKAIEQVVSLRKKDHANASKLEYDLINKEINRLRINGVTKDTAIEQIKNRYVNEYYEHYGLETKKSDGSWQDKVLQFLGLGGENRRFGGFNRDKLNASSSDQYKDTSARFDMLIETMERRYDIYSNEDVEFIQNLRREEGRE